MTAGSDSQDIKLMAAIKRGDREAFEQLFYRYYRRLYAFFYRLCWDDGRAEDMLQETFLRVWRGAMTFREDLRVSSWIYRIGRNCWIDLEARRKNVSRIIDVESDSMLLSGRVEALSEGDPRATRSGRYAQVRLGHEASERAAAPAADSPDRRAVKREAEEAVREGLLGLDPMHRMVLVMSFYQGMTYAEISEAVEIPVGTVKSRVYYAERKMRERLKKFMPGAAAVTGSGASGPEDGEGVGDA